MVRSHVLLTPALSSSSPWLKQVHDLRDAAHKKKHALTNQNPNAL